MSDEVGGNSSKPKTPPWVERYKLLKRAIEREPMVSMPTMEYRYMAFTPDNGLTRLLLKIGDDSVVTVATVRSFADDVINYLQHERLYYADEWQWDYERATKFANFYLAVCQLIEEPKAFRWKGESGFCYQRLPWELRAGDWSLWKEFLQRLSNRQAFMDWIGSLFIDGAYMQDYVWVQGMGEDGKGVLNRFLHQVFGRAYRASQPPRSEHWHEGLIGKRLVVFPDCNNTKFVTSGEFKSLTGGDPIEVNPKYQAMFTYWPKAKYLFFSNERPEISSERADIRRLVLCEFDPKAPKIDSEDFEGELFAQGGPFLYECMQGYAARSKGTQAVVQEDDALENVRLHVSTLEEEFEIVFEKAFLKAPGSNLTPADFDLVMRAYFQGDRRKQLDFRSWLERIHGIRKKTVTEGKTKTKRYAGVLLRYSPRRELMEGEKALLAEEQRKRDYLEAAKAW
jgi:hypothetical protein